MLLLHTWNYTTHNADVHKQCIFLRKQETELTFSQAIYKQE